MKTDHPAKIFLFAFLFAMGIYVVAYSWIEHRRTRNGPWELTFSTNLNGNAVILVNQSNLNIQSVSLSFSSPPARATTNLPVRLAFAQPKPVPYDLPFGRCIFMDTTFLPGTLTFSNATHEIELLPRVLIIDHAEHPWKPGEVIQLKEAAATPAK
jgi:hypothetical protein